MYAYDLLVDPQTFQSHFHSKRASTLPAVDESTQIKLARMQFEVALREAKTAGWLGDAWDGVKNWMSNVFTLGNTFIVGLKDLVIRGITALFKAFLGNREFADLFTNFFKKWVFESMGPIVFQSYLQGANEYISASKYLDPKDIQPEYLTPVQAAKDNIDYPAYFKGFEWAKFSLASGDLSPTVKKLRNVAKDENLEDYLVARIEDEFPARALIKIVEEVISLINPVGVWEAMKETYAKVLGTNAKGGKWGVFKAGVSALLVGSVYGLFKYFIYLAFGKVAFAAAFGTGVVSGLTVLFKTFIYKYGKVGFAKSSAAKLLMKGFKKLWLKFVKSEEDTFQEEVEEEAKQSPEQIFLENARGKLIPAEEATKEDIQGAVRVAHLYMRGKELR